jgi:hypothetical protein
MIPNPDYAIWCVHDQHVLTYLVTSVLREVLASVASNMTAVDMWEAISKCFASQSQSHILYLRNQLIATQKVEMTFMMYFSAMRSYTDEMAAAGKPLNDDDIVSYILNNVDTDYNSLIEQVNRMTDSISPKMLYSRLLDTKARLVSQKAQCEQKDPYHMTANTVARGGDDKLQYRSGSSNNSNRGYPSNRGGFGRGKSGGRSGGNPNNPYEDHQCQGCGRFGHTVLHCWKRYDKNYSGPLEDYECSYEFLSA